MSAFMVSTTTMHVVIDCISRNRRSFGNYAIGSADSSTLSDIGTALFALNQAALKARYGDEDQAPDYTFRQVMPATDIQSFKAVQCLLYQCNEGDVPASPLFKELEEFVDELARKIVCALPAYGAAKWDLPEATHIVVRL